MDNDQDLATKISQGRLNISRRNFLGTLLAAGAGFMVLPPASTYDRVWRVVQQPLLISPAGLFDWFNYTPDGMRHCVWDDKRNNAERVRAATWDEYAKLANAGYRDQRRHLRKLNII